MSRFLSAAARGALAFGGLAVALSATALDAGGNPADSQFQLSYTD